MALGPAISLGSFWAGEARAARRGERRVRRAWALHLLALAPVAALVAAGPMPLWGLLASAYLAHALLKIRTFAEHRAHERLSPRSVIIEDRGPLALLFLNNNLHLVHHMHPKVPWYRLPALYRGNRKRYLVRNGGYAFSTYGALFRRYLWRGKEPVAHPFFRARKP
jgi:fatty acid desaturase